MDVGQAGDRDSKALAPDAAEEILYRAQEAGLSFKITMGNVLTLTPPLTIAEGRAGEGVADSGGVYRGGGVG